MVDVNAPTGPSDQPFSDRLIVSKTQEVKADKERPEEVAKKNPQGLLMAGFCAYVQKMVKFLTHSATKKRGVLSGGSLEHHLMEFKKSLTVLTQENQSRNQEYVFHLVAVWHSLLENLNLVEFLERKKSPLIAHVKAFIETFRAYPPKEAHSIGFYMTEFSGKDWLPFPFMELLDKLHEDCLKNKEKSQLSQWIASIDQILSELTRK